MKKYTIEITEDVEEKLELLLSIWKPSFGDKPKTKESLIENLVDDVVDVWIEHHKDGE